VARAHRQFRGSARSARLTQWIGPALQEFVAVASGGATLVSLAPFEEPSTVIRSRGMFTVKATSYAADLRIVGAMGIAIVSSEAAAAGVSSLPEPYTDADWGGWFVWRSFSHAFELQDATASFLASWSMEIDSKAMRKITPNETLVVVAESFSGGIQVHDGTRHLLKLS